MNGLDTNVLVRYLTQDDPSQSVQANELIEKTLAEGKHFFISIIVLCELVWVLMRAYHYSKSEVISVLEKMLLAHQFEIEDKNTVRQALNDFKNNRADFADCLIGIKNNQLGCETTLSFDKGTQSLETFTFLSKKPN
jgi:predicted nucleic-acid-binding protein